MLETPNAPNSVLNIKKGKNDKNTKQTCTKLQTCCNGLYPYQGKTKTTDQLPTEKSGPQTANLYIGFRATAGWRHSFASTGKWKRSCSIKLGATHIVAKSCQVKFFNHQSSQYLFLHRFYGWNHPCTFDTSLVKLFTAKNGKQPKMTKTINEISTWCWPTAKMAIRPRHVKVMFLCFVTSSFAALPLHRVVASKW